MKITKGIPENTTAIINVTAGEVVFYDGDYYIVSTNWSTDSIQCVRLDNGRVKHFERGTLVKHFDAEVIIK